MLVSAIVNRAMQLLQDATNVRWPETEIVGWLSDGQREVVLIRPDASVTNASMILLANSTKQTLPVGGIRLLDYVRNMGVDGLTPGSVVRLVTREVLDAQIPTWHTDVGQTSVKHFCYDPRDPKHFYVYPRPHATIVVQGEILYSSAPADCALPSVTPSAVITLDDVYGNALLDYVLYRAYSKDAEYAANAQRAQGHYASFAASLGVKLKTDMATAPQAFSAPFNPSVAKTGAPA
jgi:hypothetical protein